MPKPITHKVHQSNATCVKPGSDEITNQYIKEGKPYRFNMQYLPTIADLLVLIAGTGCTRRLRQQKPIRISSRVDTPRLSIPRGVDEYNMPENGRRKTTEPISIPQSQRRLGIPNHERHRNTQDGCHLGSVRFADNLQHPRQLGATGEEAPNLNHHDRKKSGAHQKQDNKGQRCARAVRLAKNVQYPRKLGAAVQRGPRQSHHHGERRSAHQKQPNRGAFNKVMTRQAGNTYGKTPALVFDEYDDDNDDDDDDDINQDVVMENNPLEEDNTRAIEFVKRPVSKETVRIPMSLLTEALRNSGGPPKSARSREELRMHLYIQGSMARNSRHKYGLFVIPPVPVWHSCREEPKPPDDPDP